MSSSDTGSCEIVKRGFLEKQGGKGIMASWQTRWFVLTNDNLSYFSDQSLRNKKGEVQLNHLCSIKRKAPEGSRKFLLQLENKISGRTLLLCPHDLATLSSWEQAIGTVLEGLGKDFTEVLNEQIKSGQAACAGSPLPGVATAAPPRRSVVQMSDGGVEDPDASVVLKSGYLHKQGHRVQTWTKRWFTLTPNMLTYYTDDSLQETKGALPIDQFTSVARRKGSRRPSSVSLQTDRQFLLCMYMGSLQSQRTDLLMSMSNEESRLAWECALVGAALRCKLASHVVAVRVDVCDDYEPFVVPTVEAVYVVKIYRFGKRLSRVYFHFADLRKMHKKVTAGDSNVTLNESFPRTYKRNSFGVQLSDSEAEGRRFQLEKWLQEAVDRFQELPQVSLPGHSSARDTIAAFFGCSADQLSAYTTPGPQNYAAMVSKQGDSDDDQEEPDSDDDDDLAVKGPADIGSAPAANTTDENTAVVPDTRSVNAPCMPEKPSDLKAMDLSTLAILCKQNRIDCSTFKGQKHYVKALLETYQKRLPYLHGKDARAIIRRLAGLVENEGRKQTPLDPDTVTEIDNIFSDLLYKLEADEARMSSLQVQYSSAEKMRCIAQAVAVWDAEVNFTQDDTFLLQRLSSQQQIDGFLLLTLEYRLRQATRTNQFIERFCAARGLSCLQHAMDLAYDQRPIGEMDATCLFQILKCYRVVVESDCGLAVMDSRGVVEGCVAVLQVRHKAVTIEVLQLLTELVISVGEEAPARVCLALESVALALRQKPFEILVIQCRDEDGALQCAAMGLVNTLMLYERDIQKRLALRQALSDMEFDKVCADWVKEYRLAGNAVALMAKSTVTAEPAEAVPSPSNEPDDGQVGMYEEDGFGEEVELTYNTTLRPGVRVADLYVQEGFADNEEAVIHPERGIMEGFAIEIVESPLRDQEADIAADALESVSTLGKYVSDRLSLARLSGGRQTMSAAGSSGDGSGREKGMDFRARRIWYRLSDQALSWSDSFDSEETGGSVSVAKMEELAELGSLSVETLRSLQNCFSIIFKDGKAYHMCADSKTIKLQWLIALRAVMKKHALRRLPFRLPVDKPRAAAAILTLRKDFENHFVIYKSLAMEDIGAFYSADISDVIDGRVGSADPEFDAVAIAAFINYELKNHRNGGKIYTPLQDLCAYIHNHYAPRPPPKDEDAFDGSKYPPAVPPSDCPPPRAPPLPFVPDPKPARKPAVKVKQLFWTPIKPANVVNTVWRDLHEPEVAWTILDTQFAAVQSRAHVKSGKSSSTGDGNAKAKAVALFDSRRTQNVAIACGKLKKSPDELYDIVLAMDPDELTADVTDTILNLLLPTNDELSTLKSYTGDVQDLDFCGKLFSRFALIERLEQRLTAQRTMLSWFEQADVVFEQLSFVKAAISELTEEKSLQTFRRVLATVLSVGNYLNGGTRRGQVHGYRLDLLLKLRDVKQTGGRRTLLHFIVDQLSTDEGNNQTAEEPFYVSWKHMWLATKVNMGSLEVLIRELQGLLEVCMQEMECAEGIENEKARHPLMERLSAFITSASETYSDICEQFDRTDRAVGGVKRFLGEYILGHSSTASSDEDPWQTFFLLISKFADMYRTALQELAEWKQAEKRHQHQINARDIKQARALRQVVKTAADASSALVKSGLEKQVDKSSLMAAKRESMKKSEDALQSFKDKMLSLRKRNSAVELEPDSSDDDDDDDEW